MECINCNANNNLKERQENEGRCKKCNHEFVFEPAEIKSGIKITDDLFKDLIAEVSAKHTLFFTPIQLYYSWERMERSLRSNIDQDNRLIIYLCGGGLLVSISIWIFDWLQLRLDLITTFLLTLYALGAVIIAAQFAISPYHNRKIRQNSIENIRKLSVVIFSFGIPLSILTKTLIDPAMPIGRALAVRVEFIDTKADLERGFATLKAAAWPSTSIIPLRRPLPSPRRRLAADEGIRRYAKCEGCGGGMVPPV